VRESRTLRLTWRGLETWPWWNGAPIPHSKERDWKPSSYRRRACPRPYWREGWEKPHGAIHERRSCPYSTDVHAEHARAVTAGTGRLTVEVTWPKFRPSLPRGLSRRVRPGAHRVTLALRLAACPLHHSQSALGAFFRRMKTRLGTPKAITVTAHKLARLVYSLLQHGSAYVQQGLDAYEAQYRERKVTTMTQQAKALGYTLVPLAT
jgi:hypothetical protein